MEVKPRSLRRHHYQRLKNQRRHYYSGSLSDDIAACLVTTATPCSCFMCGNPRRHGQGMPMQERRLKQDCLLDDELL